MILERTNNLALDIRELNAMNLEHIASTFLPKTTVGNDKTDPYIGKFLTFLKAELNLDNHQAKTIICCGHVNRKQLVLPVSLL